MYPVNTPVKCLPEDTLSTKSKNLFAYAENNPVTGKDISGNAVETVFDIVSLTGSIVEVYANPMDPFAWACLVGDAADVLIPGVGGIGEVLKGIKTVSRTAESGDTVSDLLSLLRKGACFVAGTPVLTREGFKNIEEIRPGDLVYSKNVETGETGWKEKALSMPES